MNPTPEEIQQMPAGPELNILIGIEIFGLEWGEHFQGRQSLTGKVDGVYERWAYRPSRANKPIKGGEVSLIGFGKPMLPDFSGSITGAWLLVEKLTAEGWGHKHQVFSAAAEMPGWQWTFMRPGGGAGVSIAGAEGETAPLAICRAALLTLPIL